MQAKANTKKPSATKQLKVNCNVHIRDGRKEGTVREWRMQWVELFVKKAAIIILYYTILLFYI